MPNDRKVATLIFNRRRELCSLLYLRFRKAEARCLMVEEWPK